MTGRVVRIEAQPGQRVKKGAPLAIIESPDVGTAFSDLGKAHADLDAAEHDFKRQKELFDAHAASQNDYETSLDNYQKAKAELTRAQKKAQLLSKGGGADAVTQEYTLRAPIDGEVIARNVNPGMEVQGQYSQGTAVELFTVGELDRVWVMADVFEMDLGAHQGGRARHRARRGLSRPHLRGRGRLGLRAARSEHAHGARCAAPSPTPIASSSPRCTRPCRSRSPSARRWPSRARRCCAWAIRRWCSSRWARRPTGCIRFERRPVAVDEDEGGDYLPVTHGLERGEKIVTSGAILLAGMI